MDEANKPDNLEKLIKEAAEGAKFDFNSEAWADMEAKLDGNKWRIGGWWKFGIPIILVLLLAVLLWPQNETSSVSNDSDSTDRVELEDSKAPVEKGEADDLPLNEQEEQDTFEASKAEEETEVETENVVKEPRKVQRRVRITNRLVTNKLKAEESQRTEYFSEESNEGTVNSEEVGIGSIKALDIFPWEMTAYAGKFSPWEMDSSYMSFGKVDTSYRKFTYGVVASLDLSSTRLEGFTDPGTMVGLIGEYRFNKNWALQSGVAYSRKIYSALGTEYETPAWALNAPDVFTSVLANCLVIDIPLNIKRYITTQKGNQWFVSGGLSNYLMIREDYDYEYSENRPAWPDSWRYENRNNHVFGILNVSAGVVRPLTKKLNINIEPFMKLPLTGIGEGRVKFLSFGTNVSITLK